MRLGATVVIGVACVLALQAPARGDDAPAGSRAVIDRVELEPSSIGGLRLKVALSALALQGQVLDLPDAKSIRLLVNGGKLEAPLAIGSYAQTGGELAIVVVLEANAAYADALPAVLQTFDDGVLDKLSADHTQLAVLTYGDGTGTGKLSSLKTARGKWSGVTADPSGTDPALSDTLDRALLLLKKAKTNPEGKPLRKIIVLIGDGRDRASDRERVTKLGQRAAKEGVRIHSFGYAPSKVLRSLLTLGELSKRSLGTFRWVRSGGAESWAPAFAQLHDEIAKQYLVTFFVDKDNPPAGKLKIAAGRSEAMSNELAIPEPSCSGTACPSGYCVADACVLPRGGDGRGIVGWILLIVGLAVGVVVVLGVVGWLIQRQRVPMPFPGVPGMPGQPPQPGAPPPPAPAQFGSQPPGSQPPGKRSWFKRKPASPPPAAMPAAMQLPTTGPALMVMSGPLSGQRFGLLNGFTVGKAPTAHLHIDDGYTSTHHAQVTVEPGGCRLYDLNSTNGTYANGVRITTTVLEHGMAIRIGSTELRFLAQ